MWNSLPQEPGAPEIQGLCFIEDLGMKITVGIFSRSDESEYAWLTKGLSHRCAVLPVYISNSNRHVLVQQAHQCQFAILYHTKNRGRVNITNVTDSLYDDEITMLSKYLGKKNVLAVIDDLDDSSKEAKDRILNGQPTLQNCTREVFLFTKLEKQNEEILRVKVQLIIGLIQRGTSRIPENTDQFDNRQDEENPARSGRSIQIVMVMILTAMVWKDTYLSPDHRNLFLASLWASGFTRTFFWKPSKFFWFNSRIHFMLSCIMTLVSSYHAYRRPSIENICLPAFWCAASLSQLHSLRSPSGLKQLALNAFGCGLVVYSFWNGLQIRHITDVPEMIIQTLLCSPVTLIVM